MAERFKSKPELELAEDETFVRRQHAVQRVGWFLMAALVVAALAGAFGRGPLSNDSATARDQSLSLEYDRFGRSQAETELKFHISEKALDTDTLRLWLDRQYMARFQVVDINPEPERTDLSFDRMTLVYRVPKRDGPLSVKVVLEPTERGSFEGACGIEGKDSVAFKQFVYP